MFFNQAIEYYWAWIINHFSDALCNLLLPDRGGIPPWVNRLANGGGLSTVFSSCLLRSNSNGRDEGQSDQQTQQTPSNAMPNPWAMNSSALAAASRSSRR